MDIAEALQIIIDLATLYAISEHDNDEEYKHQMEAIHMVEDMAVNQFGDD